MTLEINMIHTALSKRSFLSIIFILFFGAGICLSVFADLRDSENRREKEKIIHLHGDQSFR